MLRDGRKKIERMRGRWKGRMEREKSRKGASIGMKKG